LSRGGITLPEIPESEYEGRFLIEPSKTQRYMVVFTCHEHGSVTMHYHKASKWKGCVQCRSITYARQKGEYRRCCYCREKWKTNGKAKAYCDKPECKKAHKDWAYTNCKHCGKSTKTTHKVFCNYKCLKAHTASVRQVGMVECAACGKEIERITAGPRAYSRNFCSRKCQNKDKRKPTILQVKLQILHDCRECGARLVETAGSRCVACRTSQAKMEFMEHIDCAYCGIPTNRRKFCSDRCNNKYQKDKRRTRLKQVSFEPVNDEEVFNHHNYQCHYCSVDLVYPYEHGNTNSATIDHVIPLSKGGKHERGNLVAACLSCNSSKSNKLPKVLPSGNVSHTR